MRLSAGQITKLQAEFKAVCGEKEASNDQTMCVGRKKLVKIRRSVLVAVSISVSVSAS